MDIADLDLNLLVVFDALLRNRSVTGAARTLGMSQPATSFALNRLRRMFGDPLFVRTPRGIQPTPFAENLAEPLKAILDRIRTDLLQQPTFDPATVQRAITFNLQDIGELVFLPPILKRMSSLAPGIDIRTVNLPVSDLYNALQSGEVDLAIGHFPELASASMFQQQLFAHGFVCLTRKDHPVIGSEMSRKQFVEGWHGVVHPAGQMNDTLEHELTAQGLQRKVVLRIEHFLAVPTILSQSELIFTVPFVIGEQLARLGEIKLVKPPFKAKPRIIRQHWHTRFHHDAANQWIRRIVAELFAARRTRERTRA
jgi:DNA-binding transcriptional LysR family regulator